MVWDPRTGENEGDDYPRQPDIASARDLVIAHVKINYEQMDTKRNKEDQENNLGRTCKIAHKKQEGEISRSRRSVIWHPLPP